MDGRDVCDLHPGRGQVGAEALTLGESSLQFGAKGGRFRSRPTAVRLRGASVRFVKRRAGREARRLLRGRPRGRRPADPGFLSWYRDLIRGIPAAPPARAARPQSVPSAFPRHPAWRRDEARRPAGSSTMRSPPGSAPSRRARSSRSAPGRRSSARASKWLSRRTATDEGRPSARACPRRRATALPASVG